MSHPELSILVHPPFIFYRYVWLTVSKSKLIQFEVNFLTLSKSSLSSHDLKTAFPDPSSDSFNTSRCVKSIFLYNEYSNPFSSLMWLWSCWQWPWPQPAILKSLRWNTSWYFYYRPPPFKNRFAQKQKASLVWNSGFKIMPYRRYFA